MKVKCDYSNRDLIIKNKTKIKIELRFVDKIIQWIYLGKSSDLTIVKMFLLVDDGNF